MRKDDGRSHEWKQKEDGTFKSWAIDIASVTCKLANDDPGRSSSWIITCELATFGLDCISRGNHCESVNPITTGRAEACLANAVHDACMSVNACRAMLTLPGTPSWSLYRFKADLKARFEDADLRVCTAFWLFGE